MKYRKYLGEESRHGVVSNMDEAVAKELSKRLNTNVDVRAKKEIRFIFGDVDMMGKEKEIINWLTRKYAVKTRNVNLDLSQQAGDVTVFIEE
jgi:hypothetical protein